MPQTRTDDLARFRSHTGAPLRPLHPEEPCPVLFRDLGPEATTLFLRGGLERLAGPLSPIIYMRDASYVEPYTDPERIGRLVFLRAQRFQPWHVRGSAVYVAHARHPCDPETVAFVPGDLPLDRAALLAREVTGSQEWRELLGGPAYDQARAETLARLDALAEECAATEEQAAPVRAALQSFDRDVRRRAREAMARLGLSEEDLCTAWHHLPRPRRQEVRELLLGIRLDHP
jgi:hypothetical protein